MAARSSRFGTPAYGQHFLHDRNILSQIVGAAGVGEGDIVLEVGVGTGKLTRIILATGASVTGVEVDAELIPRLEKELAGEDRFRLVKGDILRLRWDDLLPTGQRAVLMGNLPYAVSTQVVFRAIDFAPRIRRAVFLVQWEVGRRMAADPGNRDYGILAVACQLFGRPEVLRKVPPGVFLPPPKVDSALIRWDISPEPVHPIPGREFTMGVVKAAFGQRRKKLVNSMASGLPRFGKDVLVNLLVDMGLDPNVRAEQLAVSQFAELAGRLYELKGQESSV